jgi:hypothetical protein
MLVTFITGEKPMPRPRHYSPAIERFLVSVLYHEAKLQKMPMTVLANQLLAERLKGSPGWLLAEESQKNAGTSAYVLTDN